MNAKVLQMSASSYYSLNFSVVWHVQRTAMVSDFIKQNKLKQNLENAFQKIKIHPINPVYGE